MKSDKNIRSCDFSLLFLFLFLFFFLKISELSFFLKKINYLLNTIISIYRKTRNLSIFFFSEKSESSFNSKFNLDFPSATLFHSDIRGLQLSR